MMKILYLAILIINGNAIKMQRCIARQMQTTVRREMQINPMLMQRAYFGETFKQKFNYTKIRTWLNEVDWDKKLNILFVFSMGILFHSYLIQYKQYRIKIACKDLRIAEYKKRIEIYEKNIEELKANNSPQHTINVHQDVLNMFRKDLEILEK